MATKFPRRFEFSRDPFAVANELVWEYRPDAATGKMYFLPRGPRPAYAHRCFVLTRASRQFFYHARFDAAQAPADESTYRRLVREVVLRNPHRPCGVEKQIVIPGYVSLRQFTKHENGC